MKNHGLNSTNARTKMKNPTQYKWPWGPSAPFLIIPSWVQFSRQEYWFVCASLCPKWTCLENKQKVGIGFSDRKNVTFLQVRLHTSTSALTATSLHHPSRMWFDMWGSLTGMQQKKAQFYLVLVSGAKASTRKSNQRYDTTFQSIVNVKLIKQRFWPCQENGLIKTIQTIPHNL